MEAEQGLDLKKDTVYDRALLYLCTAIFASLIVMIGIQISVRQLNLPIASSVWWTEALSRVFIIVGTFLGAAVVTRNREHIQVGIFRDRIESVNPAVARWMDVLSSLLAVGFLLLVLHGLLSNAWGSWAVHFGGFGGVTIGNMTLTMGIGVFLMVLFEVAHVRDRVGEWRHE